MNLLSRVKGHTLPAGHEPGAGTASGKDFLRGILRRDAVFTPAGFDDPAATSSATLRAVPARDSQASRLVPTLSASRVAASEEAQTRYAALLFNAHRLGGSET